MCRTAIGFDVHYRTRPRPRLSQIAGSYAAHPQGSVLSEQLVLGIKRNSARIVRGRKRRREK